MSLLYILGSIVIGIIVVKLVLWAIADVGLFARSMLTNPVSTLVRAICRVVLLIIAYEVGKIVLAMIIRSLR